MLFEEARWLGHALNNIQAKDLSPLINVGSSTKLYRGDASPFIDKEIFEPLKKRPTTRKLSHFSRQWAVTSTQHLATLCREIVHGPSIATATEYKNYNSHAE